VQTHASRTINSGEKAPEVRIISIGMLIERVVMILPSTKCRHIIRNMIKGMIKILLPSGKKTDNAFRNFSAVPLSIRTLPIEN